MHGSCKTVEQSDLKVIPGVPLPTGHIANKIVGRLYSPESDSQVYSSTSPKTCTGTLVSRCAVLTARHCEDFTHFRLPDGTTRRILIHRTIGRRDIALDRLDKTIPLTKTWKLADSKEFVPRERLEHFGYSPNSEGNTQLLMGSTRFFQIHSEQIIEEPDAIITKRLDPGDSTSCHGDSGGPTVDKAGKIIGVNSSGLFPRQVTICKENQELKAKPILVDSPQKDFCLHELGLTPIRVENRIVCADVKMQGNSSNREWRNFTTYYRTNRLSCEHGRPLTRAEALEVFKNDRLRIGLGLESAVNFGRTDIVIASEKARLYFVSMRTGQVIDNADLGKMHCQDSSIDIKANVAAAGAEIKRVMENDRHFSGCPELGPIQVTITIRKLFEEPVKIPLKLTFHSEKLHEEFSLTLDSQNRDRETLWFVEGKLTITSTNGKPFYASQCGKSSASCTLPLSDNTNPLLISLSQ